MKSKKIIAICLTAVAVLFSGGVIKAEQSRNAELECAKGSKYHWDLPYTDFSLAEEAVETVTQTPDTRVREADIKVSKYSSVQIGEELDDDNQISPDLNFQLNVLLPNRYFMDQARSVVAHVHYPTKIKAGESNVISVHLKDSYGAVYEGEWSFIANEDLWLTPGFMDYDGLFWESKNFSMENWVQVADGDGSETADEKDYSSMAVFRFYASTNKVYTLEKEYERGCRHGGCSTVVHSLYGH